MHNVHRFDIKQRNKHLNKKFAFLTKMFIMWTTGMISDLDANVRRRESQTLQLKIWAKLVPVLESQKVLARA